MEENDFKDPKIGSRRASLVLKESLVKTLKELQIGLGKDDPIYILSDSLIQDAQDETNTAKIYHQIKILNEVLQRELGGTS